VGNLLITSKVVCELLRSLFATVEYLTGNMPFDFGADASHDREIFTIAEQGNIVRLFCVQLQLERHSVERIPP